MSPAGRGEDARLLGIKRHAGTKSIFSAFLTRESALAVTKWQKAGVRSRGVRVQRVWSRARRAGAPPAVSRGHAICDRLGRGHRPSKQRVSGQGQEHSGLQCCRRRGKACDRAGNEVWGAGGCAGSALGEGTGTGAEAPGAPELQVRRRSLGRLPSPARTCRPEVALRCR